MLDKVSFATTLSLDDLLEEIEKNAELLSDLKLDVLTLDASWIEQPVLSFQWNRLSNLAEYCLKQEEKGLKDLQAETYLRIRSQLLDAGEKVTETLLANKVATDKAVTDVGETVAYLQYICTLLVSAKKAIDDRRRALEGLVTLHSTQYFTNTVENPALEELGTQKVKEQHKEVLENNKRLRKIRDRKRGEKV